MSRREPRTKVHTDALSSPKWYYELIPSRALPVVDLSQSLKDRFLPKTVQPLVEQFLVRFHRPLLIGYLISMGGCIAIPYMDSFPGRIAASVALVMGLPMCLGGLSNLRFDMVRLVLREDNVWFFCFTNLSTQILNGIMYGDLRALVVIIDFIGITNVVFIDAKLQGIRRLTQFCLIGLLSIIAVVLCILFNRIDQPHGTSLWTYEAGSTVYEVAVSDYVVNGYTTIGILLAKIIYRKKRALRRATRSSVIECVIFRCCTKLSLTGSMEYLHERQHSSSLFLNGINPINVEQMKHLQRLQHVRSDSVYDARTIVFPVRVSSKQAFPRYLLVCLYLVGVTGFSLVSALVYELWICSITSAESSCTEHSIATTCSAVCSLTFCSVFFMSYQRNLLMDLATSFDFVFYSLQVTSAHLAMASLGGVSQTHYLCLVCSWVWTHWVLCLDALTPIIKSKLRFHVHVAAPVVCVMLVGDVVLAARVLFAHLIIVEDRETWSLDWPGHSSIQIHVLPFMVGRSMILATWKLRLLARILHASNTDTIILRGAVTYKSYVAEIDRIKSRRRSIHPITMSNTVE